MYVVRIARPNAEPDYMAFSSLHEAKHRFYAADDRIPGDFDSVTLFEATVADDASKAVDCQGWVCPTLGPRSVVKPVRIQGQPDAPP